MSIFDWLRMVFTGTVDVPSPSDVVPWGNIILVNNPVGVMINLANLNIPFTTPPKVMTPTPQDTNSMDPGLDYGHNVILIKGADEANQKIMLDSIKKGDVAVYCKPHTSPLIIHRIVKTGEDEKGRWFRFKGDNNAQADSYLVRDSDIQFLLIGIIY